MRVGLSFPNFGPYSDPRSTVKLAVTAEEAGWDAFFSWDHLLGWSGNPVADPWILLGAIGEATERILTGPMVAALPRHRPWNVARQMTSLDLLTGGRAVFGVGIGFPPDAEFGTFGEPTDDRIRADMLDESLEIIAGMWTGEPFSFEGEHYRVSESVFVPTPSRQIPIWVAGMWPNRRPFRRAARYDGVYPIKADMSILSLDEIGQIIEYTTSHRSSDDPLDVIVAGPPVSPGEAAALAGAGVTWYLYGPHPEGEPVEATLEWLKEGPPEV